MIIVGIDPGLDGAVAIILEDGRVEFYDTPTVLLGKRRDYDLPAMAEIVRRLDDLDLCTKEILVGLEKVHAMPKNGSLSAFGMGRSIGAWEMALVFSGLPYELIAPQRWKKAMMDGMPKEKDSSRVVAMRLFPQAAVELKLRKHHGRADALLIAAYRRTSLF